VLRVEYRELRSEVELWVWIFCMISMGSGKEVEDIASYDTYTKECHRIEVDRSIGGRRVTSALSEVASVIGLPGDIVVDNGPGVYQQ